MQRVSYAAPGGEISGYLVALKGSDAKRPAVIVVHENRGLNPHIEDVTRRFALEGFLAFAPDLLTLAGGTPTNEDEARDKIAALNKEDTVARLVAAVSFLGSHPRSTGKVGAVGFCWGGGMVNELAAASPDLDAAVAYYGMQVPAEKVAAIRAPLLLHYAGLDERINAGIDAYRKALEAHGKTYRDLRLRRREPRLQQRHQRGTLRQGGSRPRLAADGRFPEAICGRAAGRLVSSGRALR